MRRWLACGFISTYLTTLAWGLVCHTLSFNQTAHPLMYYIVWDMFCGWGAYASHIHVIAEGESGKFYELTPPPWGEMRPYGSIGRQHYDSFLAHASTQAMNVLQHTRHEPITRMFVVESAWAKKYDLPDFVWNQTYNEPKDPAVYYRLRQELSSDGMALRRYSSWGENYAWLSVVDNPRLKAEARAAQPFFMVDRLGQGASYMSAAADPYVAAPQGN